jgi:hypothetical protein
MTSLASFSAALKLLFGLSLLWFLAFRLFSEYRTDALRDRLFALRERLFDYAADGCIRFDEPAYTKLRGLINSLIRFAHRLSFTRFFMGVTFMAWRDQECDKEPLLKWNTAVDSLPHEHQKATLRAIHTEMLVLVVRHLVSGSPIMVVALLLFAVWATVNGAAKRLLEAFTTRLPGLDILQAQAVAADAAERQSANCGDEVFAHQ